MKKANPRLLALRALNDLWQRGLKPKDALDRHGRSLDARDRAFLMELLYGVLRNRYYLDWCLSAYLEDPSGLGESTLNNLRLGAYQAFFTRVPARAVVYETTEVEKAAGRKERLVNAVLRRLVREKSCPPLPEDTVKRLSILTTHPEWLLRRWIDRFGPEEAEALARANNEVPPLTLRVNTLRTEREGVARRLSEMGIGYRYTEFSPVGIKIEKAGATLPDIEGLLGEVFVQDEGAQLITYLLRPEPGQRILDACAAPGGKTTHIAELTSDRAEILALESSPERLRTLKDNIARWGIGSVETVLADLRTFTPSVRGFHRVLLDAPCSSLGVIRRNPDVRYRHTPGALRRFQDRQIELLTAAGRHLLPGGMLLYSVCSTEPEEGEEVIRRFLHKEDDFFIIDTDGGDRSSCPFPVESKLQALFGGDGFFRTYPHRNDMDGFFAARLSRRG